MMEMSEFDQIEGKETWDRSLRDQMHPWQKTWPLTLKRALRQVKHIRKNPLLPLYRETVPAPDSKEIALKDRAERLAERNLHFVVLAYRTVVDEEENEKNFWIFSLVRKYYGVPEGQPISSKVKRRLKNAYHYALKRIQELELRKAKTGQGMGHYHDLNEFQKHNALIDEVKRKAKAKARSD
jgi:hypothetical protein